jgi:hypothetical protein
MPIDQPAELGEPQRIDAAIDRFGFWIEWWKFFSSEEVGRFSWLKQILPCRND